MVITSEDRTGLDKSLKELNLSNDECDKFAKAFKDPEFLKLFEEYAKEVSDPKVKEETDMYLRQLEMEGRLEEIYGKGAQLILPEPSFVIKTQNTADGTKVFINMCTSDKVEKASLESATGTSGQRGKHFNMPLCLGPKKVGEDKGGRPCSVWDFVVHPETIAMALVTSAIKTTMIETALEKIEESNEGVTLHRDTKMPKMTYKATEGCPTPHALTLRGVGGTSVKGRVKPVANGGPIPGVPANGAAGSTTGSTDGAAHDKKDKAPATRSKFGFSTAKPAAAIPKAVLEPTQTGYVHPGGAVTPEWSIIHRGQADLTDTWGDAGRGMAINTTHPKELVIRITLPGLTSAAGVQLEVSRGDISVGVPQKYLLAAPLPFAVDSDKGKAKFDKVKQQLEVVVPVIPPVLLAPAVPTATTPTSGITELPTASETAAVDMTTPADDSSSTPEPEGMVDASIVVAAAQESPADRAPQLVMAAQGAEAVSSSSSSAQQATENERRWMELHGTKAVGSSESQGPVREDAQESAKQEEPHDIADCGSMPNAHDGALSESDAVAVATIMVQPEVIKLQPRLNHHLTADLD